MANLVRDTQGQLSLTDPAAQDTQKLAALQGMPVTPMSPAGVTAVGGSPDQAKMAGTKAQQQGVLQQQTPQAQTLAQAQRTEAPKADAGDDAAAQKAAQLQSLGSLQTRVQALINKDLTFQQPATAQVDTQGVQAAGQAAGLSPDDQAQAQALIQKIAANPSDTEATAAAAQFWVSHQMGTIDTFSPDKFMASAQTALSAQAQQQVNDTTGGHLTLEQLGLTDAEQQNLQSTFGEGWQQLTVPALTQKIEALRQAEYNRIGGIKAELMTATGTERAGLVQELAAAGQAGATGAEQQMKQLTQAVSQGDSVNIGGTAYKVADLLKDGEISDLVGRMLNDPALAGQVAKTNHDFAAWVQNNAKALGDLSSQAATTMGSVRGVQAQKQQLATVGNTTLTSDVMKDLVPDWDKITATVPDTSKVGILGALQDSSTDTKTKQDMATALNDLKAKDPDAFDAVKGLDAASVKQAWEYGQDVAHENDASGLLGKLTGADGSFVTDQAQQAAIEKYKPVVDAVNANADALAGVVHGDTPQHAALFQQQIATGQLTAKDIQTLAQHPEAWDQYTAYHDTVATLDKASAAGDVQTVLDTIFGKTTDVTEVNDAYKDALKAARFGDPDAIAKVASYKRIDRNGDGVIDGSDLAEITKDAETSAGPSGTDGTLMERFLGGGPTNDLQRKITSADLSTRGSWGDLMGKVSDLDNMSHESGSLMDKMFDPDGKLTTMGTWMEHLPDSVKQQYGIPSNYEIQDHLKAQTYQKASVAANSVIQTRLGDLDAITKVIDSGKHWDDSGGRLPTIINELRARASEFGGDPNADAASQYWIDKLTMLKNRNDALAITNARDDAIAASKARDEYLRRRVL